MKAFYILTGANSSSIPLLDEFPVSSTGGGRDELAVFAQDGAAAEGVAMG